MNINVNAGSFFRSIGKTNYAGGKKQRKTVDEVVTGDVLEKVRQIAVRNAEDGNRCSSTDEVMKIANECRGQVGPDRSALLTAAQNQLGIDLNSAFKENRGSFLDYVFECEGKFGGRHGEASGSYEATVGADDHVYMKIYDENGECAGTYDSVTGFKPHPTSAEEQCRKMIWGEYKAVLNIRLNELSLGSGSAGAGHLDINA